MPDYKDTISKEGNETYFRVRRLVDVVTICIFLFLLGSCVVDISHPDTAYRRNEEAFGKFLLYLLFMFVLFAASIFMQLKVEKAYVSKEEVARRDEATQASSVIQLKTVLGPLYPVIEFIINIFKRNKG